MSHLNLNPNHAAGSVDRPVFVPVLAQPEDTATLQALQARATRRRTNAVRIRMNDQGLRQFRVY
jgi:hypothetical protein